MKSIISIFLLLNFLSANADGTKRIVVINKDNNEAISFATVAFYNEEKLLGGNYTNVFGHFSLQLPENTNRLEFSCIGFKSSIISLNTGVPDTLKMESIRYEIPEIAINLNNKSIKPIKLGYLKKNSMHSIGYKKNTEIAVYIPNKIGANMLISKLFYKLRQRTNVRNACRVHLYSNDNNLFSPGKELITSNLIFYFEGSKIGKIVEMDVSSLKLEFPIEGIFVGLEWIGIVNEKADTPQYSIDDAPYILTTPSFDKTVSFQKKTYKKGEWINSLISLSLEGDKNANFAIGMEVTR